MKHRNNQPRPFEFKFITVDGTYLFSKVRICSSKRKAIILAQRLFDYLELPSNVSIKISK